MNGTQSFSSVEFEGSLSQNLGVPLPRLAPESPSYPASLIHPVVTLLFIQHRLYVCSEQGLRMEEGIEGRPPNASEKAVLQDSAHPRFVPTREVNQ